MTDVPHTGSGPHVAVLAYATWAVLAWLAVGAFCIGMALADACFQAQRRRRLMGRQRRSVESLLDDLGLRAIDERAFFRAVLDSLGSHLGVPAEVLRADDYLDRELALSGLVGLPDTALAEFFEDLRRLLLLQRAGRWPRYSIRGKSLADLVGDLRGQIDRKRGRESFTTTRSDEP